MSSAKAPVIAIVGANGYIGKLVTPELYTALKEKRIKELRILTRKASPVLQKNASEHGAMVHEVVYSDSSSLQKALTGVDVLISTDSSGFKLTLDMMGLQGSDWEQNKEALVDVLSKAKVSVYIPSEFGTYHYVSNLSQPSNVQTQSPPLRRSPKEDPQSHQHFHHSNDGTSILQTPWI